MVDRRVTSGHDQNPLVHLDDINVVAVELAQDFGGHHLLGGATGHPAAGHVARPDP